MAARLATLSTLDAAVVETVVYADVFDWPLTAEEVHRFLPVRAELREVCAALQSTRLRRVLSRAGEFHVLQGRQHLAGERARRTAASQRIWPGVLRRARLLARIPWLRMVAVSGSLAVSAAREGDDVDLFIVTDEERLWTSRALTILAGRLPATLGRRRPPLCPNYMVTVSALQLEERDVYTAHELAQLVPLVGADTYAQLLACNGWYRDFLPNHDRHTGPIAARPHAARWAHTRAARTTIARFERWEMDRKVARLSAARPSAETRFDATTCKGHFDGHRRRFWDAYEKRMQALEALAA